MLLLAPAVDELCSAALTVTAPGIQTDLELGVGTLAAMMLVLPLVLGIAIEPAALLLADGRWRRPLLVASAGLWASSLALAGTAATPWVLAVAMLVLGPASGVTLGVARVALLAQSSDRERTLNRWTLSAAAGDLAGPLVYAAILTLGGSWRHAFLAFSAVLWLYALVCVGVPLGAVIEREKSVFAWPEIRRALRDRPLLAWLFAVALCTLLDEIMVLLCALWVAVLPGGGPRLASLAAAAFIAGMVVALSAVERRWVEPRLSVVCAVSLVGLALLLLAPTAPWSIAALFVVGLGTGSQYPMTLARAHARLPSRPGLVSAIGELFRPLDLALPLLVGLCAERFGLAAALALLAFQPLGILSVLKWSRRRDR